MILTNVKGLAEIHRKITEEIEFLLEMDIDSGRARNRITNAKALLDSAENIIEAEVKNEDDYK
jgi:hypothetical protein